MWITWLMWTSGQSGSKKRGCTRYVPKVVCILGSYVFAIVKMLLASRNPQSEGSSTSRSPRFDEVLGQIHSLNVRVRDLVHAIVDFWFLPLLLP